MTSINPPIYTPAQLASIFSHLRFFAHEPYRLPTGTIDLSSLLSPSPSSTASASTELLAFLTELQRHCLTTIPFENTSLHYSPHHGISLDPTWLYEKIVERGKGGYCMENNKFLLTLLRSLGVPCYAVGARVSMEADGQGEGYGGWSHMVIIVVLPDSSKWALDIGFGANGPTAPLKLEHGWEASNILPARMRLKREFMPETAATIKERGEDAQKVWSYQVNTGVGRFDGDGQTRWEPQYVFVDLEFTEGDFEIANFWTSRSRGTFFTREVVGVKFFFKDGEEGGLGGCWILDGKVVKRREAGKTEVWVRCESEEQRIDALKEIFGVELREEERRGIRGLGSEIRS